MSSEVETSLDILGWRFPDYAQNDKKQRVECQRRGTTNKRLVQTDGKPALNVAVAANGSAPRTYDRRRDNQQVPALQSAATAPIC